MAKGKGQRAKGKRQMANGKWQTCRSAYGRIIQKEIEEGKDG